MSIQQFIEWAQEDPIRAHGKIKGQEIVQDPIETYKNYTGINLASEPWVEKFHQQLLDAFGHPSSYKAEWFFSGQDTINILNTLVDQRAEYADALRKLKWD